MLGSIALLLLGSIALGVGSEASTHQRRVIILTGTEVMLPVSQIEDAVIRQMLSKADLGPIEFYSEGMDSYRFHSEDFEAQLVAFLERKYAETKPDLVFALEDTALGFLVRNRQRLWPDAPVVFTNVDQAYFQTRSRPSWATGVLYDDSVTETVDLARRLQPGARRVVVFTGVAQRETAFAAKISPGLEALEPRLEVVVRAGVPVADFRREFGNLSDDTILLFTTYFRDAAGRNVVPQDAAVALAAAASIPVYAAHAPLLGRGIIGGAMFDYEHEGRVAALMGIRILAGEAPGTISILGSSPPLLAVDVRQLQRFHIPESRVPKGYEIRYRQPSFWNQYRWRIVTVAVAIGAETMLIIALLVERRLRRVAQNESRQRRRELALAARMATVGELATSISHEINQPLGAIQANAEAAEMLLASESDRSEEVRAILLDIRRDDQRASEIVQRVRKLAARRELEIKPLAVNSVVDGVVRLLGHDARRHGVKIEKDLGRNLPEASGDEVALQQVLINLALNGMEAMDEVPAERRRLVIGTRPAGDRVSIRVSDAGKGIAIADRPRLFGSFFTTKPEGVGLGLAICRSIVEAHGGTIEPADAPGGGTVFEFSLPIWVRESSTSPSISSTMPKA